MKHLALNILLLAIVATGAKAQDKRPTHSADFANWVIESNIKTPKNSVVKFYNAKQELIYQEEIKDKKLNVNRKKIRTTLNELLAKIIVKNEKIATCNLVIASLKRD